MKNDFDSIASLLDGVSTAFNFNEIRKRTQFLALWKQACGKKFENNSKAYELRGSTLVVACQNSYVAQELSMYKRELIKKINTLALNLKIEVKDLIFSYKIWENPKTCEIGAEEPELSIKYEDYQHIELDEEEIEKIKKSVSDIKFISESKKENLVGRIIDDSKRLKYIDSLGYKTCPNCCALHKKSASKCHICGSFL